MLIYFHHHLLDHSGALLRGSVVFSRASYERGDARLPAWADCGAPISSVRLNLTSTVRIEETMAHQHLDFANKQLHIGQLIPSATQEEILFSIKPECLISLLIVQTLGPLEAAFISHPLVFADYKGYLDLFEFKSLPGSPASHPQNQMPAQIVAIDAIVNFSNTQWSQQMQLRDLNKAFIGFSHSADLPAREGPIAVSTGNWGCGAFGGDPILKFLQQMMAAAAAGRAVDYAAFGDRTLEAQLRTLYNRLVAHNVTVGQLCLWLFEFGQNPNRPLVQYILGKTSRQP
eukprot:TRINITY_DN1599_c0_g1_i7.p1 TRINITY_DN1599_c0_g1~~TRINITY_DN1599_c0_g1_i7.p1  ORF type:complete len:287 (-),score=81.81 TRINITY_DN1599_c0_g1_i7:15-875(-)